MPAWTPEANVALPTTSSGTTTSSSSIVGETILPVTDGDTIDTAITTWVSGLTANGGIGTLPLGTFTVNNPITLPDHTILRGQGGRSTTTLATGGTFPTSTVPTGSSLTIPGSGSFTVPYDAADATKMANAPATGAIQLAGKTLVYTSIDRVGHTLTCVAAATDAGAVADLSPITFYMFYMGDPVSGTLGAYGTSLRELFLNCATNKANGVYSNRWQEFSGLFNVEIYRFYDRGLRVQPVLTGLTGQTAQNWSMRGATMLLNSAGPATSIAIDVDGAGTTIRGIDDVTLTTYQQTTPPSGAIGVRVCGCGGVWSRIQVEDRTDALYVDNTTVNRGLVIESLWGTRVTNVLHIGNQNTSSNWTVTATGLVKLAGSTNIVKDDAAGTSLTDNTSGYYIVGIPFSGANRPILTDLLGQPSLVQTAAVDTNTKQIASTAFVLAQAASATPLSNGTAAVGTSTRFARGDHVHPSDTSLAPLNSPTFTGTVTLPSGLVLPASVSIPSSAVAVTQSPGDNSTKVATTAYADAIAALKADLASPTFTGTPNLPTGTVGVSQALSDSSTKLATTFYADRAGMAPSSLMPQGMFRTTYDRMAGAIANIAGSLTTQVVRCVAIHLVKGEVVSNIIWVSGTTALVTGTHQWAALTDSSRVQLATSNDLTSTAWAANSPQVFPISTIASGASSTFTATYTGLHYLLLDVAATTVPTLAGQSAGGTIFNGGAGFTPIISGSGETLNTAAPAFAKTYTAFTNSAGIPYAGVS